MPIPGDARLNWFSRRIAVNETMMPLEETAPRAYEAIVIDWIKADSAGNWIKGDLAGEVETVYGQNRLGDFARDVETPLTTVRELRRVAVAYPETSRRLDISWSVHQALACMPDRAQLIGGWSGTVAEARELVRLRNAEAKLRIAPADPSGNPPVSGPAHIEPAEPTPLPVSKATGLPRPVCDPEDGGTEGCAIGQDHGETEPAKTTGSISATEGTEGSTGKPRGKTEEEPASDEKRRARGERDSPAYDAVGCLVLMESALRQLAEVHGISDTEHAELTGRAEAIITGLTECMAGWERL